MPQISRCAAGRRRFEDSPSWANNQMAPLLDSGLVQINSRGHYCVPDLANAVPQPEASPNSSLKPKPKIIGGIVGGDYFPSIY